MPETPPDSAAKPAPIPAELRKRVNRHAHAEAQKHAIAVRDRLIENLQNRANAGARGAELTALLDTMMSL